MKTRQTLLESWIKILHTKKIREIFKQKVANILFDAFAQTYPFDILFWSQFLLCSLTSLKSKKIWLSMMLFKYIVCVYYQPNWNDSVSISLGSFQNVHLSYLNLHTVLLLKYLLILKIKINKRKTGDLLKWVSLLFVFRLFFNPLPHLRWKKLRKNPLGIAGWKKNIED